MFRVGEESVKKQKMKRKKEREKNIVFISYFVFLVPSSLVKK